MERFSGCSANKAACIAPIRDASTSCPSPGAIVQYENGIVDFNHDACIGCQYCTIGCPFNVPKFNPKTKKVFKCSLCSDRVSQGLEPACIKTCPTGCLQFGSKEEMLHVAHKRADQLKEHYGYKNAGVYDPPGVGGTGVIYVLHDVTTPEAYGGLPKDPQIPCRGQSLEDSIEMAWQHRHGRRHRRHGGPLLSVWSESRSRREGGSLK